MTDRRLTYLACPYSHPERSVRVERFEAANNAAGLLMARGYLVFSPLSHTHPIAEHHDLPKGWDYWEQFDRAYLAASRLVVVLCIDGWRESKGVTAEITIAEEMGIPVHYMHPVTGATSCQPMEASEPCAICGPFAPSHPGGPLFHLRHPSDGG